MEKRLTKYTHRLVQTAPFGGWRVALAASLFLAAGCSQVPDEVNPVEWYKGVDNWLNEPDESYTEAPPSALGSTLERERVATAEESFPNLSDVPPRPPAYDPEAAAEISRDLVADRAHAKYSDEKIRFQSEADTALSIQKRKLAEAPPPAAAPRAPVRLSGELSSPTSMPEGVSKAIGPQEGGMSAMTPPPPPVLTAQSQPIRPPVSSLPVRSAVAPQPPPMISRPMPQSPAVAAPLNIPASDIVPSLPYFPTAAPELNQTMNRYFSESGARALPANFQQQPPAALPADQGLAPLPALPQNGAGSAMESAVPAPKALITKSSESAHAPRSLAEYSPANVGMSIRVATVNFAVGSSSLSKEDRAVLQDVVGMFRQNGKSIRVIGHASSRTRDLDPMTHQLANFNISVDRANSVAKELMRLGIGGEQIFVGARSDSEPIYYEVMPSGEAGNRRTEIYIDY